MAKIIRRTYRRDFSIGVLLIIFATVFFLADQLFVKRHSNQDEPVNLYLADALVSTAVLVMVLILWEEILFNVHIKPSGDGLIFRNHGTKLKFQALLYLIIPLIVVFLYLNYHVSVFRFFTWAGACLILPVAGKLRSGIRNYNDFLRLTGDAIEYKNNEQHGTFALMEIKRMHLIKDESKVLHKLRLELISGNTVTIDLDEMELEDYYQAIDEYIAGHYANLLK